MKKSVQYFVNHFVFQSPGEIDYRGTDILCQKNNNVLTFIFIILQALCKLAQQYLSKRHQFPPSGDNKEGHKK